MSTQPGGTRLPLAQLNLSTVVPLYTYPAPDRACALERAPLFGKPWQELLELETQVALIVNVHNGPGERPEPQYVRVLDALAQTRHLTFGYVPLHYGARAWSQAVADAARWEEFYGVAHLFLDEFPAEGAPPSTPDAPGAPAPLIGELRRRAGHRYLIANPGVPHPGPGARGCDGVVTREMAAKDYLELQARERNARELATRGAREIRAPHLAASADPMKIHLIHSCSPALVEQVLRASERESSAARQFISAHQGANPWRDLGYRAAWRRP